MNKKITYKEISESTGISMTSVQNAHKKSGLVGEQLLNYITNNVIGVALKSNDPIKVEGVSKLILNGEETTELKNAIIFYNKMIDRITCEELNHATFINYTKQLKAYTELIQNLKDKQGIVEGVKSAIED